MELLAIVAVFAISVLAVFAISVAALVFLPIVLTILTWSSQEEEDTSE